MCAKYLNGGRVTRISHGNIWKNAPETMETSISIVILHLAATEFFKFALGQVHIETVTAICQLYQSEVSCHLPKTVPQQLTNY